MRKLNVCMKISIYSYCVLHFRGNADMYAFRAGAPSE